MALFSVFCEVSVFVCVFLWCFFKLSTVVLAKLSTILFTFCFF